MDRLVQLSPTYTRPRCLVIVFSGNISTKNEWVNLFKYAWNFKFLDFTIVKGNMSYCDFQLLSFQRTL